jgi:hypothetical protein
MGKQVTPKKRALAQHYAECGDIAKASGLAGYANPSGAFRVMRRDGDGVIIDEVMRALLIEAGVRGVTPIPPKLKIPAGTHLSKTEAKILQMSEHRPVESGAVIIAPTLEQIRGAMWRIAEDDSTPSGPRVQALTTLLKDAKDEFIPDALDETDVVEKIKLRLGLGRAS